MDASNRDVGAVARLHEIHSDSNGFSRTIAFPSDGRAGPLARIAALLVHDWLDRDALASEKQAWKSWCRAFPDATLYTLIHKRGSLSPAIESMAIRPSPLQRIPGVFRLYRHLLPIMPMAARAWRPKDVDLVVSLSHCVAKAIVPPEDVPHRSAAAFHADALRLART